MEGAGRSHLDEILSAHPGRSSGHDDWRGRMKYEAWTWKAVEARVLEMADTLRISPAVRGPKMFGSAMPEPVRRYEESYGHQAARYRETASAGSLSRMSQ